MRKNQNKLTLKAEVYEKLKLWDKKRAQILRYHKKASEQIFQSIQRKVEDSKDFLSCLQTILQERVNQLIIQSAYCANSVVDSELVLQANKNEAYANHYDFLKQIYNIEAITAQEASQKLSKLTDVLNQLKGITGDESINQVDEKEIQYSAQRSKNDQSSLIAAKGDIKYLIQCQLPEIVEKVIGMCEKVSKVYNEDQEKDLYFSIQQFIRSSYKQTSKHRQIGKSIISYVSTSIKREISVQNKIRSSLQKWSIIDGPIDEVFLQQLKKKNSDEMIKSFYNIEDMTDVGYDEESIEDFLINFKIEQFSEHLRLKLCDIEGIYNGKIQTRVIVTVDCFVHLVRLNAFQPDFSFRLNPELTIRRQKQTTVQFIQYKKKFYFKKQRQFDFNLQLSNEQDLQFMRSIIQKISETNFQFKK